MARTSTKKRLNHSKRNKTNTELTNYMISVKTVEEIKEDEIKDDSKHQQVLERHDSSRMKGTSSSSIPLLQQEDNSPHLQKQFKWPTENQDEFQNINENGQFEDSQNQPEYRYDYDVPDINQAQPPIIGVDMNNGNNAVYTFVPQNQMQGFDHTKMLIPEVIDHKLKKKQNRKLRGRKKAYTKSNSKSKSNSNSKSKSGSRK